MRTFGDVVVAAVVVVDLVMGVALAVFGSKTEPERIIFAYIFLGIAAFYFATKLWDELKGRIDDEH